MDYVLFGMGYGASLMLLGWALRTFGPQLKYRKPPKDGSAEFHVGQRFWVRFIQGLGGVVAIAGTALVLLTFVVVLVNPSDAAGSKLAIAFWAAVMISILVWCWFYVSKFGLAGIWSRESGYGLGAQQSRSLRSSTGSRVPAARKVSSTKLIGPAEPEHRETEPNPVITPEPADSVAMEEADPADAPLELTEEPQDSEAEPEQASGPVYDFGDSTETTVPSDTSGRSEALRRLRERQARARQATNK